MKTFLLFSFHFDRDKTDLNTFQLVQSRSLLSTVNFPPLPAKFINLNNFEMNWPIAFRENAISSFFYLFPVRRRLRTVKLKPFYRRRP